MRRALLLEDSPSAAAVALAVLRGLGYRVTWRRGVLAALTDLDEEVCLLLLDVGVSGSAKGGLVVARSARKRWPEARVVVWSAGDHEAAARELGCVFVRKGGAAELREALELACARPV